MTLTNCQQVTDSVFSCTCCMETRLKWGFSQKSLMGITVCDQMMQSAQAWDKPAPSVEMELRHRRRINTLRRHFSHDGFFFIFLWLRWLKKTSCFLDHIISMFRQLKYELKFKLMGNSMLRKVPALLLSILLFLTQKTMKENHCSLWAVGIFLCCSLSLFGSLRSDIKYYQLLLLYIIYIINFNVAPRSAQMSRSRPSLKNMEAFVLFIFSLRCTIKYIFLWTNWMMV